MTKQDKAALFINAVTRQMNTMFPGYFPDTKHNHYKDFGWPEHLTFAQLYSAYDRNSIARAAVRKTSRKVWQTSPVIREADEGADETTFEEEIRRRFQRLRLWQKFAEAERRSMVGSYAGLILRVADDKSFREPVDSVTGGLDGLVEVIPAWENQLTVSQWDDDAQSETYGRPKMFQYVEAQVGSNPQGRNRAFEVHPDRVIIVSTTGDVHGESLLRAGYNDLIDMEKIKGAGGEGFWKNAKAAPVLQVDKDAQLQQMAQAMGVDISDIAEAMNEQTEAWQKGFDKLLMVQGIEAKTLGITLPDPEPFFGAPLQSFAASVEMPVKILIGMQTGERASQEDANEWSQTCMGRRSDITEPAIMEMVNRLEMFGILPDRDWWLDWDDLTEATQAEKIDRASKMADVNQKSGAGVTGEYVFTPSEIRDVGGFEGDAPTSDPSDEELGLTPEE